MWSRWLSQRHPHSTRAAASHGYCCHEMDVVLEGQQPAWPPSRRTRAPTMDATAIRPAAGGARTPWTTQTLYWAPGGGSEAVVVVVDTSKPFTVTTQFVTDDDDNTTTGTLSQKIYPAHLRTGQSDAPRSGPLASSSSPSTGGGRHQRDVVRLGRRQRGRVWVGNLGDHGRGAWPGPWCWPSA